MKKITSIKGQLNSVEMKKWLKGIGLAISGASIVIIGQAILGIPVEQMWAPLIAAVSSILINLGRKLNDSSSVNII